MATYHLHRWSVVGSVKGTIYLSGYRDQETKKVTTSRVDKVNGREITTRSGSVYILEDIEPEYLQYLNDTGDTYNPENPIRVKIIDDFV